MECNEKKYLDAIREKVQELLGGNCVVMVEQIWSNEIRQMGMRVVPVDGFTGMSTVVGIKDMERFGWDIKDTESCAEGIVRMYAENKEMLETHGFTKELVRWEEVKGLVYPLLLSVKGNEEILPALVHERVLDFAVIYMIRIDPSKDGQWVIVKVTESIFRLWNIEKGTLHQTAMENLRGDGLIVMGYIDLFRGMITGNLDKAVLVDELKKGKRYVLTNRHVYYGASAILDQELLGRMAKGGKLYIMPIDVHSVIIVKDDGRAREEYYNGVVRSMNDSGNEGDARFTDHAYCYDGRKNKLCKCFG